MSIENKNKSDFYDYLFFLYLKINSQYFRLNIQTLKIRDNFLILVWLYYIIFEMKKITLWIFVSLILLGFSQAKCIPWEADCWKAGEENIICTMEYAPVCAEVEVKCVQAPCPGIKQTFGNKCQMNANKNAKFLYEGECREDNDEQKFDLSNCETYFDGCNNCSVVDWEVSACTLMYCENPWEAKCIKYKDNLNLNNCETYFDGCNNCMVVDWKIAWCTKMSCQTIQEAKCIKYKDSVWMANPASVYCENNWWNLVIENNEKGQIWICVFNDWSNCEEWAFFRWECKKSGEIEKYLSWYIEKNSESFSNDWSKINFLNKLKFRFTDVYRSIYNSIQKFIDTFYKTDYETKKITLDSNWTFMSFSLDIPKDWKNKYSERVVVSDSEVFGWLGSMSTLIFEYNQVKWQEKMIFSISMVDQLSWEELTKEWEFNMNKILEKDAYVFFYSNALDMPYTWEDAEIFANMVSDTKEIIESFDLIVNLN